MSAGGNLSADSLHPILKAAGEKDDDDDKDDESHDDGTKIKAADAPSSDESFLHLNYYDHLIILSLLDYADQNSSSDAFLLAGFLLGSSGGSYLRHRVPFLPMPRLWLLRVAAETMWDNADEWDPDGEKIEHSEMGSVAIAIIDIYDKRMKNEASKTNNIHSTVVAPKLTKLDTPSS